MTASTPPVEVHDLRKSFGTVQALDGLDLVVEPGQVAGFLGPNGAGKSTTIRVLLGLLHADAGTARLFGRDPWTDGVGLHERLAYVPGDVTLWPQLTGGETIDLLLRLRGLRVDEARKARMLHRFELDPTKRTRTYSKGNRQKVALVAAFCADVELLVLDEPTSGLDPLLQHELLSLVEERVADGATVFLSSHVLPEVERVADRIGILRRGQLVQVGGIGDVRTATRQRLDIHLHGTVDPDAFAGVVNVAEIEVHGNVISLVVEGSIDAVIKRAATFDVERIVSHETDLEDAFLDLYR
jgi:ABC-2 type transport system ATP-binding protein